MCKIGHSSALCESELALQELAHFLTRPVTIATPVNKSTSILAVVLPYSHPEAHRAFGRDIIYTIILYYYI